MAETEIIAIVQCLLLLSLSSAVSFLGTPRWLPVNPAFPANWLIIVGYGFWSGWESYGFWTVLLAGLASAMEHGFYRMMADGGRADLDSSMAPMGFLMAETGILLGCMLAHAFSRHSVFWWIPVFTVLLTFTAYIVASSLKHGKKAVGMWCILMTCLYLPAAFFYKVMFRHFSALP
ncbi:MAG: hypothetical protein LBQ79_11720 [Deltaproteobacteria bacterium]|jgi:hypothetical protein|nr:hypothetical protein [Deltaproteobacteria bacterium]